MNSSVYKMVCSKKNYVEFCVIVYVWCGFLLFVCDVENFEFVVKMDEDRWMYDNIMSEEVEMNDENKHQATVNEEQHVDCSDVFNTSQVIIRFIVIKLLK